MNSPINCKHFSGISSNMIAAMNMITQTVPECYALIQGAPDNSSICGTVLFYSIWGGTLVVAEVRGLPGKSDVNKCSGQFFGFHIHEGNSCETTAGSTNFAATGNHYNPADCAHPFHAGDMPVLLGDNGYALNIFYTNRFTPDEVVGRTVVIHDMPDDFRTQPSGDSGTKIACGKIQEYQ